MLKIILIAAFAVVALIAGCTAVVGIYFFESTAVRKNTSLKRTQSLTGVHWEQYDPTRSDMIAGLNNMPAEDYYIKSFDGLKLHGCYIKSKQTTEPIKRIVICFHGYTSRCIGNNTAVSVFFMNNGFDVLLPDARAHGDSEGRYIGFGILDKYDGLEWIKFLKNKYKKEDEAGRLEIYLYGVSMGGATVCMLSGLDLPSCVKAAVSDCAFASPKDLFTYILRTKYHIPTAPIIFVSDLLFKLFAGYSLGSDSSVRAAENSKIPMLFFHGAADGFIPPDMCDEIYSACASDNKQIVKIKSAGHAEAYFKNSALYEEKLKEFLKI